jgi:biotin transport system substrate-specific component
MSLYHSINWFDRKRKPAVDARSEHLRRRNMLVDLIRGIVFSALFAALMVVLSFINIHLGFTPVPITLENMGPMLAGAFLGPVFGFFSVFLVVFLTALGLPLMHGQQGLSFILGPTGGFIWMFPISALLTGLIVSRIRGTGLWVYVKVFLAIWLCSLTVFLAGVPWLAHKLSKSIPEAMAIGFYPFIIGDILKALAATLIVVPIRRIFPTSRLIGGRDAQVVNLRDE